MEFLDFLKGEIQQDRRVEYRLFCSGVLYREQHGDWRRSDGARELLSGRFELLNASQPADASPQELVLRFDIGPISIRDGNSGRRFLPAEQIVQDFCAIMTLLTRRLVTVGCKTHEYFFEGCGLSKSLRDFPVPIHGNLNPKVWKQRPADVIYRKNDIQVIFNDPPPVKLDSGIISRVLANLPVFRESKAFMRSCRLYSSALENIETRHELAYQSLISAIDTLGQAVYKDWPDDKERLAIKSQQVQSAIDEGLDKELANRLILKLSKSDPLAGQKFRKFIKENIDPKRLDEKDDLFLLQGTMCPTADQLDEALTLIWNNRGRSLHGGQDYPATASVGTSTFLSQPAAFELSASAMKGKLPFPPVTWFERVVHRAITSWLFRQLPLSDEAKN